ncbi:hypothetical protein JB92DRAFT_2982230 [Gautieria morchelliformis]|nr:hypothetical protein JB92DRAFT_2982230 [Gautieria morchelliformis]
MAHEYSHIGTWSTGPDRMANLLNEESMRRDEGAMATFLLTTLLLPALLVAPIERDIRVINFVNPFYAAAAPAFNPRLSSVIYNPVSESDTSKSRPASPPIEHSSSWSLEGQRALRTAVFIRHLQRILDALPEPGSSPTTTNPSSATRDSSTQIIRPRKSNILAVTVSPGISRTDTIAPYLLPSVSSHRPSATRQWVGATLYILLLPFLHLLTKTPTSALQSVIHVLCLPKPHTRRHIPLAEDVAQPPPEPRPQISAQKPGVARTTEEEEVLVPGALYADCSVVRLDLGVSKSISLGIEDQGQHDDPEQFELGLGNEPLGRAVWEALEDGVKIWEQKERPEEQTDEKGLEKN